MSKQLEMDGLTHKEHMKEEAYARRIHALSNSLPYCKAGWARTRARSMMVLSLCAGVHVKQYLTLLSAMCLQIE